MNRCALCEIVVANYSGEGADYRFSFVRLEFGGRLKVVCYECARRVNCEAARREAAAR